MERCALLAAAVLASLGLSAQAMPSLQGTARVERAKAADARTVAEVVAGPAALNGKTVTGVNLGSGYVYAVLVEDAKIRR